jgi:CRP/FNR family transcriptional regulator
LAKIELELDEELSGEHKVLWCMENFDLLQHLSMLERERLRRLVRTLKYKRGESIYLPGDPGDTIYFLRKGRVKLAYLDESGKRLTLMIRQRGEPFGEVALAGEDVRKLIAEALENIELCAISTSTLLNFAEENPGLSMTISKLVGLRLSEIENRLEDLLFKDVPTRLARLLLKLCEEFGEDNQIHEHVIPLKLTHQDVADLIGSARETTSIILGEFVEEGLIQKQRSQIIILDLDGIKAKARM